MTTAFALVALVLSLLVFRRGELTSQRWLSDAGWYLGLLSMAVLALDAFVTG